VAFLYSHILQSDRYHADPSKVRTSFPAQSPFAATSAVAFDPAASTLQAFLDALPPHTLVALPGIEITDPVVLQQPVHLRGAGTVLHGTATADAVSVRASAVILENLTIAAEQSNRAGAVSAHEGYTWIRNCSISSPCLDAVAVEGNAIVDIESCEIVSATNPCVAASQRSVVRCAQSVLRGSKSYGIMSDQEATVDVASFS
jgi:nitrous oxidase accessory protein NosD